MPGAESMLPRMAPFQTININSGTLHKDNVYSDHRACVRQLLMLSKREDLKCQRPTLSLPETS